MLQIDNCELFPPENENFSNQSKIITTPYVNFPFKQLNKTYMDVRIIYDFDKILNISDLSGEDLIFIMNKRYESEIKKILGKTNASLLGTTNDYLLFDLQTQFDMGMNL